MGDDHRSFCLFFGFAAAFVVSRHGPEPEPVKEPVAWTPPESQRIPDAEALALEVAVKREQLIEKVQLQTRVEKLEAALATAVNIWNQYRSAGRVPVFSDEAQPKDGEFPRVIPVHEYDATVDEGGKGLAAKL